MAILLTIDEEDYNEILSSVGYPVITEDDLGVSEEFIKNTLILRPLKNVFFKWFPILERQQVSIGTSFSINFPDENTFGVTDIRLVPPGSGTSRTGNPLINEAIIKVRSGGYYNKWGTGNDYGYAQVYETERARVQSAVSINKSLKKIVDYTNRKITGYSNITGELSITWAKYSDDFNDIPHKYKEDVIKLCQSSVLRYFGMLRNQSTSNLPTELDGTEFIDRADELYDDVMTKFKQYSKVVLIRT
jgi:hypothetical protein